MSDRGAPTPSRSVLDHKDLVAFFSGLAGGARWGCQAAGAARSDAGFSRLRFRVENPRSGRWEVRELKAELVDGVPRIGYYASEYESSLAAQAAMGADGGVE